MRQRNPALPRLAGALAAWATLALGAPPPTTAQSAAAAPPVVAAIETTPPAEAARADGHPPEYMGEPISLDFQDIEIRGALQLIADFAGLNLIVGDAVAGRVTLRLNDVPWDEALDLILTVNGLGKRQMGNVLLVAPATAIAAREKLELESRQALAQLAPLETEFIRIRHADATAVAALFSAGDGDAAALTARGQVLVDKRTNSLILTDTAASLAAFKELLTRLDIPVQQVQIEARIVNAGSNFSEQLGVRWGGGGYRNTDGPPYLKFGGSLHTLGQVQNILARAAPGEQPSGIISHPQDLVVDLGVVAEGVSSIGLGLTGNGYLLDLELSALAAAGHAEIIARPKVITTDKRAATIETGVEIPYQQATHSGATSIAFKDAVLQLNVTPQITPDQHIVMDLEIKQDTVGRIFHGVPSINTTRITTQVLVENGDTVVLGGVFRTDKHQTVTRTPLLGELPLVGRLFRRTLEQDDKQELFVFITPQIIDEQFAEPDAPDGQ